MLRPSLLLRVALQQALQVPQQPQALQQLQVLQSHHLHKPL